MTHAEVDGTASLFGLSLPPHRVNAVTRRINKIARSLKRSDDRRTTDQIRADVFLDLLSGVKLNDAGSRAVVDIRVDLATLIGANDNPAEIPGFGPVIADIARKVVQEQQDAEWRYAVVHENGQIVSTGITQRRPTAAQTRGVHTAYPTCVFPGCPMPATDCDLDHREAWADGGPTTEENLAPLCRHDHIVRPNTTAGNSSVSPMAPTAGPADSVISTCPTVNPHNAKDEGESSHIAFLWHTYGMPRVRISTTVDEALLSNARRLRSELKDAALLDEALGALLSRYRAGEIDAAYRAYDEHPIDEPDEWGDLKSFREAASSS